MHRMQEKAGKVDTKVLKVLYKQSKNDMTEKRILLKKLFSLY